MTGDGSILRARGGWVQGEASQTAAGAAAWAGFDQQSLGEGVAEKNGGLFDHRDRTPRRGSLGDVPGIAVVGNGDVFTARDARQLLKLPAVSAANQAHKRACFT
jgi:hypothetical protein